MDPIIIEKNIPIPLKNTRTKSTRHKYDFLDKLVVGDSVELNVLKVPVGKKGKNSDAITYYGLMNAIHRTQKDSEVRRRDVNNTTFGRTKVINNPKKFTVRTLRLENTPKGMIRVMRLWRIV